MMNTTIFTKEGIIFMKKVVNKAINVMFLLALTVTLNAGFMGSFSPADDNGISPLSDEPPITTLYI